MSCCNHSHEPVAGDAKSCGTKKCCKGKALLWCLAILAVGFLAGRTVHVPPHHGMNPDMHKGHDMGEMKDMPKSIYDDAMRDMHKDMMMEPTGNADIDFVKGMIPHHQGAIDMAKILLRKGEDPEIKKLGEGIIDAQKKEISMMRDWLKGAETKLKAEQDAKAKEEKEKADAEAKAKSEIEKK